MRFLNILRRRRTLDEALLRAMRELIEGISNQSELMNRKFEQMFEGQNNQSDLINRKFEQLLEKMCEETTLTYQLALNITNGLDNQTDLLSKKIIEMISGIDNQTNLLNQKFEQLFISEDNQSELINRKFDELIKDVGNRSGNNKLAAVHYSNNGPVRSQKEAMWRMPLMIDDRTYNIHHPDYNAKMVRNYPGTIFNCDKHCPNTAFVELSKWAEGDRVKDSSWDDVLAESLAEASAVPGASQILERRAFTEHYMVELTRKYRAHYSAGWINLDEAVFLYWLIRRLKPRKIVQCGAGNGLSSSFMMLALAENGPEGTLNIIDLPQVFNPVSPDWKVEGKVYETCIPEGKTSAWMAPEIYSDRIEVWTGHTKDLLPKMVDEIEQVDFFCHGANHIYSESMFEFEEVNRKLAQGGIIVTDDISWNTAIWDLADSFDVPAYNFKGSVGVVFF